MSTLVEIQSALKLLTAQEIDKLLRSIETHRKASRRNRPAKAGLKAASRPALEGLPSDLSVNTKNKVRDLILKRHAANR